MTPLLKLFAQYRTALREEPKLKSYLAASLVDDAGVAVSTWAGMLITTNLFTDQRQRAAFVLPTLVCFLLGTVVSGPLADWLATASGAALAHWRYRLVVWARLVETLALAGVTVAMSRRAPTVALLLPYAMVHAFMKTALRPARSAFEVDLLRREETQQGPDGRAILDERGAPLVYKVHLLPFGALTGALRTLAALVGLVLGSRILALSGQRYWPLYAVDVATNVVFVVVLALACHPTKSPREVRLRDLTRGLAGAAPEARASIGAGVRRFGSSLAEGGRFLAGAGQRPLLAILAGGLIVEVVTEMYEGKMVIKHLLHGADDAVRYAELGWSLVAAIGLLLLPLLAGYVRSLGKVFLAIMFVDGLVIALAGRFAGLGAASAVLPFGVAIAVDRSLTLASGSLGDLAINSASSAAMRGRIIALFSVAAIVGDIGAEILATSLSESMGIPAMVVRVGVVQAGLVALIAALGGKKLWAFGLRSAPATAPAAELAPALLADAAP